MRKSYLSLASHLLLWGLVITILILHFDGFSSSTTATHNRGSHQHTTTTSTIRIAYFSLDSLQETYDYILAMKRILQAKQARAEQELASIEKKFQMSVHDYEKRVQNGMTQMEAEQEQKNIYALREQFEQKKQSLQMQMMEEQSKTIKNVQQSVEDYITKHPNDYPYDLVLADQAGLVFYNNARFDITKQLIEDLNKDYKEKKSK